MAQNVAKRWTIELKEAYEVLEYVCYSNLDNLEYSHYIFPSLYIPHIEKWQYQPFQVELE